MKYLVAAAAFALSTQGAMAVTVNLDTNFDTTTNVSDQTTHGELFSSFDFGGGLTGHVSVINGFGNQAQTGEARIFDTRLTGTADDDLEGDFSNATANGTQALNFGKSLIIQERAGVASDIADDERRGGTVTFFFDTAIDLLSLTYLDGEEGISVHSNLGDLGGFGSGISGDNLFVDLDFSGETAAFDITQFSVDFNGSGAIGAFDVQVAAVPLPAALPMLLAGLGGLGVMRRKRKAA